MQAQAEIEQDAAVYCADGQIGVVRQVVVDGDAGQVTDLIVERPDGERLVVPAALVARVDGPLVTLELTRGQLLADGSGVTRYRPEEFHPYGARPDGAQPDAAPPPDLPTTRLATTPPEAAAPAPEPDPPTPPPAPIDTTDPARLGPFIAGVLRIPLRGEEAFAERRAVIAAEIVIRKERRQVHTEIRATVRKERVEVRERG